MAKELSKGPAAKPVPIDDPLAKLIDELSEDIQPVPVEEGEPGTCDKETIEGPPEPQDPSPSD